MKWENKFHLILTLRNGNMLHGGGPGYFSMLKSVLSRAPHPNLLVLWYEEMKKNQTKMVVSIASHIGYKINQNQVYSCHCVKQIKVVIRFWN